MNGWLPKEKNAVYGKAAVGKEGAKMGGKTSGAKEVQNAKWESSYTVVNQSVSNKAEADTMALGQFRDRSLTYITGEGTSKGNANLRAGKVIEIAGIGEKFGGLYYLVSTEHFYSDAQGYQTSFTVRRNAT